MPLRTDMPAARVSLGEHDDQAITFYGHARGGSLGIPTVELAGGCLEYARFMTPDTADRFADGLKLAARAARGEALPTALDEFLGKRQA